MSTLPLKALSRVWGRFNEIDIPYYFRVPGFKLYSWIFGVKLVTTTLVTTLRADKSQSVRSLRARSSRLP
jgi:phosphatidylserine decarboxylase